MRRVRKVPTVRLGVGTVARRIRPAARGRHELVVKRRRACPVARCNVPRAGLTKSLHDRARCANGLAGKNVYRRDSDDVVSSIGRDEAGLDVLVGAD